ncbi:MAG: DUF885 domain-containing protein [Aliidongia sp.]
MTAKIKIAGGVFAIALALIQPASAQESQSFQDLVKSYYDAEFQAHPIAATRVGIHDYDMLVDDLSADGYAKNIARRQAALRSISAIALNSLTDLERDDREMLIGTIKGGLLDDETIQYWRHDPDRYSRAATSAVFELVHRDFAPLADRLKSVIARERQIPAMLAAGKANIEHPPRAFVEIALRNIEGSLNFYRHAAPTAFASVQDPELKNGFATSNDAVIAALEDYKAFLTDLLPKADGSFALGSDVFIQRLSDNEMLAAPVAKLREIAYGRLHQDQAALKEAAHQVDPTKPVEAVLKKLRTQHPTAATLLKTARDDLAGLRAFVKDHDLVTIPSDLLPKVEETPGFSRATTAAAMDSPGAFEQNATQAYYYVSPPDSGLSPDKLDQYLQAYYFPALDIISAHEVWPGHFMQYLTRRSHPEWSLVRQLAHAQSTTEGWAHYAEQMMIEEGLGKDDPKLKVSQIEEALLRDCRFVASIEMHTDGKSVEDATKIFMKECGSPEPEARREAYRGTSDPGYLNYTIGKLEILKLRDDYKARMGDKFSLKEFHDRFLAAGLAPVKIIRRELIGRDGSLL